MISPGGAAQAGGGGPAAGPRRRAGGCGLLGGGALGDQGAPRGQAPPIGRPEKRSASLDGRSGLGGQGAKRGDPPGRFEAKPRARMPGSRAMSRARCAPRGVLRGAARGRDATGRNARRAQPLASQPRSEGAVGKVGLPACARAVRLPRWPQTKRPTDTSKKRIATMVSSSRKRRTPSSAACTTWSRLTFDAVWDLPRCTRICGCCRGACDRFAGTC